MAQSTRSLAVWRRTRRKDTPGIVGKFFEKLARRVLLRAKFSTFGHEDLVIDPLATGVEVKSGDNNHGLRIPVGQLNRHAANIGEFPAAYDHFVYLVFCYRNRQTVKQSGRPRRSLLADCRDETAIDTALAQLTDSLYIFDHRVIERIRAIHQVRRQGRVFPVNPADGEGVVSVSRKFLRSFTPSNGPNILSTLDLDTREWKVRSRIIRVSVSVGLFTHEMRFPVVDVLPVSFATQLDQVTRTPTTSRPGTRRLTIACGSATSATHTA